MIIYCFIIVLSITNYSCSAEYLKFQHPTQALDIIAPYLPENPIVIEAGAFDGTDTLFMAKRWPKGIIHAFEPVPEIYTILKNKTMNITNIKTYQLALSNKIGKASFHLSHENSKPNMVSQSSSLLAPKEHLTYAPHIEFKKIIEVETITLDAWVQQNNIAHADLLWLDLQGYELQVLQSSPLLLKTVKAILTEVEFVEAYKDQSLYHEIKNWLETQGFTLIANNFNPNGSDWFGDALFVRK